MTSLLRSKIGEALQQKQRISILSQGYRGGILVMMVRAHSQLGTRYMGKHLKSSCLAGNELVPSMTKNTVSGFTRYKFGPSNTKCFRLLCTCEICQVILRSTLFSSPQMVVNANTSNEYNKGRL